MFWKNSWTVETRSVGKHRDLPPNDITIVYYLNSHMVWRNGVNKFWEKYCWRCSKEVSWNVITVGKCTSTKTKTKMSSSESEYFSAEDVQFFASSQESGSQQSQETDPDMGLEPYQFEPLADGSSGPSSSSQESSQELQEESAGSLTWCSCGKCRPMEQQNDRLCCKSAVIMKGKIIGGE